MCGLGRQSDTETNGSARRFVSGLPPMLSPVPGECRSLLGSTEAASPLWRQTLAPLLGGAFSGTSKLRRSTAALVGLLALLGGIAVAMTKEPEVGIGLVAVGGLLLMRIVV